MRFRCTFPSLLSGTKMVDYGYMGVYGAHPVRTVSHAFVGSQTDLSLLCSPSRLEKETRTSPGTLASQTT
jgi:hypothetical protein